MKLAELLIDLKADTATLARDFDKAHSQAEAFASKISRTLSTIGVGVGLSEIANGFKEIVQYEDQIGHMSEALGMSAAQTSSLVFAMKGFDIPLESATVGLAAFDKILEGLARSKAGATAIHELGLNLDDLKKMNAHEALLKVADAFQKMEDGPKKAAIATALFRGAGMELIPFLNQGSEGIERLEARAQQLGVTLSQDDVEAAAQAKLAMNALTSALQGTEQHIANKLIPGFTILAELLLGDYNLWMMVGDAIGIAVNKFDDYLNRSLKFAGRAMLPGGLGLLLGKTDNGPNATLADNTAELQADMEAHLMAFYAGLGVGASSPGKAGGLDAPAAAKISKLPSVIEDTKDKTTELIASLIKEEATFGETAAQSKLYELGLTGASQAELALAQRIITSIDAKKREHQATADLEKQMDAYDTKLQEFALSIGDKLITPGQEATRTLDMWNDAMERGYIDMQTLIAYQEKLDLKRLDDDSKDLVLTFSKWDELSARLGNDLSNSLTQIMVTGHGFSQMLQQLIALFTEFIIKTYLFKSIAGAFGGASGGLGGFLGSVFSSVGARASGGSVSAGQSYLVGESGPEIFSPGSSGTIIPNGGIAGGGVVYNIDARGADIGVEIRIRRALEQTRRQTLVQSAMLTRELALRRT